MRGSTNGHRPKLPRDERPTSNRSLKRPQKILLQKVVRAGKSTDFAKCPHESRTWGSHYRQARAPRRRYNVRPVRSQTRP
jgi:hypothetical protein